MSIQRHDLLAHFDALLQPERFKDYGPNGLQVEGRGEIARIVSGVTASRALIDAAIAARADAIFVHHGLFWRGMDGRVTGWMKERLQRLLAPEGERPSRRGAWCTGGAQGFFESAIAAGADAFITGEISEPQTHLARETGVAFIAAGHHATERYGAPAVAAHAARQLGLEHQFIDIDNPA